MLPGEEGVCGCYRVRRCLWVLLGEEGVCGCYWVRRVFVGATR